MNRWCLGGGLMVLAVLAPGPPAACGQGMAMSLQAQEARWARSRREQAVAYVGGSVARPLVEAYGESAVQAIAGCSPAVGRRLAEFYNSGQLGRIHRSHEVLAAIGSPGAGDAVAWWVMQHGIELTDKDACNAFLLNPVAYAMGLQHLGAGAEWMRTWRQNADAQRAAQAKQQETLQLVGCGAIVVAGIALVAWLRRRRQETQLGA